LEDVLDGGGERRLDGVLHEIITVRLHVASSEFRKHVETRQIVEERFRFVVFPRARKYM
jgi:hypothetical protein